MSYTDDTSDQEWRVKKSSNRVQVKQEESKSPPSKNKPKYAQKFLEKWVKMFDPWLTRCDADPNKPFCRACQTTLDTNRCHLQRHEQTTKHARNLEILLSKGESAARENLSIRQERSKYYQQRKSNINTSTFSEDADFDGIECYAEDSETNENYSIIKEEEHQHINTESQNSLSRSRKRHHIVSADDIKTAPIKKERLKMLMQIQKDKDDLMESFKELIGSSINTAPSPPKEKSHIDLFFESVSSSVKALTPKLIAEAKMRVSQLIGELELRALTELEAQNHGNLNIISTSSNNDYVANPL